VDRLEFILRHHHVLLMIIYDFHVEGITILPFETDTPSLVNADAVLSYPVSLQVSRRFAGGTRNSFKVTARFSIRSLRKATC